MARRRSSIIRNRLARILSESDTWMTCDQIKNRFLEEGWSFTSSHQISMLCISTVGFASKKDLNGISYYRMENLDAFHNWMKREPVQLN